MRRIVVFLLAVLMIITLAGCSGSGGKVPENPMAKSSDTLYVKKLNLPEGFIISQYAREGFFELCKVIAVNFSVLWLATRMVTDETKNSASFLWSCLIFLAESMLFAIIAFSKLYLYIHTFGFTPLRLQSTWLVCVCFAGCAFWMWSLVTGNKSFRKWVIFSAVTLCLLCVF